MTAGLPAWSEPFAADHRAALQRIAPFDLVDRGWAFGSGDGEGVIVAVVDSGVEGDHPAIGAALVDSVRVELRGDDPIVVSDDAVDAVGHGTAWTLLRAVVTGAPPDLEWWRRLSMPDVQSLGDVGPDDMLTP